MIENDSTLTQERLKKVINYDSGTGEFIWLHNRIRTDLIGMPAGSINGDGYRTIRIDRVLYQAHRLAFLYMTGKFPPADVDHINRNRADNRWDNLREATRSQNCFNKAMISTNTSGVKGVYWHKRNKKWTVRVQIEKKFSYLGIYEDLELAELVANEARVKYYGDFFKKKDLI